MVYIYVFLGLVVLAALVYRKRLGTRKDFSYEKILKLKRSDFEKVFTARLNHDRTNLLQEMIDHEDKTYSFAKSYKEENTKGYGALAYNVFVRDKSLHTTDVLDKLDAVTKPYMQEHGEDISGKGTIVDNIICAKGAVDWAASHKADL